MKRLIAPIVLLVLISIGELSGQVDSTSVTDTIAKTSINSPKLFDADNLFEITLSFDITALKRNRNKDEYLEAKLSYYTSDSALIDKTIKVRSRGIFRRSYCDFPPIFLNFKTKDNYGEDFSGIDKVKLQTYCRKGFQTYILKEYLIYKMYNVLTSQSFRVRLLKINYVNTAKDDKKISEFGFVIEPKEMLEKRTGLKEAKVTGFTQRNFRQESMDRFAIFNYMIGNTDWSVPILHNVVFLTPDPKELSDQGIAIPYDFDFSGLINASYASPFEGLGIQSVRERRYLGICRNDQIFLNDLVQFTEKKEELYKIVTDFPYLTEKDKKDMINYLESFYKLIDKRNTIITNFKAGCIELQ